MADADLSYAEPPRILVLEDGLSEGMALVDDLLAAGFAVVGPARAPGQVRELVEGQRVDAALLDLGLGEAALAPVAGALRRRGIAFAIVAEDAAPLAPCFGDAPLIPRPVTPVLLAAVLDTLVGR